MMSTPISNIRSREDDREDDLAELAEDFGEGDSDLSADEDEAPRYSRGPSRTYTNPIADDDMEEDIQPVRSPTACGGRSITAAAETCAARLGGSG